MYNIINLLDKNFIKNICIYTFLLVFTYRNTEMEGDEEEKNELSLVKVSISIGKKLVRKYFSELINKQYGDNSIRPSY